MSRRPAPLRRRRQVLRPSHVEGLERRLLLANFIVSNTGDDPNLGSGSLRSAILQSNAATPGPNTIHFAIPGTGVQTISPTLALPTITDSVVIDGYTQPGASPNTLAIGDNAVLLI